MNTFIQRSEPLTPKYSFAKKTAESYIHNILYYTKKKIGVRVKDYIYYTYT